MVGYKIRKVLRSTVPEVRSSHRLSLRHILECNINTTASWAGGQESARRPALVGFTSMAEFVVSAYLDRNLKTGVGCLLRRGRASICQKRQPWDMGAERSEEGQQNNAGGPIFCAANRELERDVTEDGKPK